MRSRLLILLSLLVLLMQPAALLHGWTHHPLGQAGQPPAAATTAEPGDHASTAIELACLECLALAALGTALPPAPLVIARLPGDTAAPATTVGTLRGGTGAGYHARGPPTHLA